MEKLSDLPLYIHMCKKSPRLSLSSWSNLTLKDSDWKPLKPRLLQMNLGSRKTKMCLSLKTWNRGNGETKSTFKILFLYYSNPQQAKEKELGSVTNSDQTWSKCIIHHSSFPWHFWVREHFTAVLCVQEREGERVRGKQTERCNIRWKLARLLRVMNKCACTCAHLLSLHSCCVSHIAGVPVSFLHYESLSDTWASPASIQLLDWSQMSVWKWCQTMSALAAHFLQFPLLALTQLLTAG